jgi:hypothetical protein
VERLSATDLNQHNPLRHTRNILRRGPAGGCCRGPLSLPLYPPNAMVTNRVPRKDDLVIRFAETCLFSVRCAMRLGIDGHRDRKGGAASQGVAGELLGLLAEIGITWRTIRTAILLKRLSDNPAVGRGESGIRSCAKSRGVIPQGFRWRRIH